VQFALIHIPHGGTSPTNMFAGLATYMRQRFYPEVGAGQILWYDVIPKACRSDAPCSGRSAIAANTRPGESAKRSIVSLVRICPLGGPRGYLPGIVFPSRERTG
jgi:hypothetical protein